MKNEHTEKKIKLLGTELSALKESLRFYKQSNEKYRQLFEKESDSVVVFDAQTLKVEEVNSAAMALFGYSCDEFLHLSAKKLFAKKEKTIKSIQDDIKAHLTQNRVFFEQFVKKEGTVFPGAIYAGSFFLKGREKFFGAIRDTTDKQKIEEKLRRSQEQLFQSQKMEALGTLVAGVAHEINNPINLIMYNIPLVRKVWLDIKPVLNETAIKNSGRKYGGLTVDFLDENLEQMISDMDLAAKRVETIVGRLKDYARKSDVFDKSEMSISDAVQNSLRLAQSTLRKSNVAVQVRLSDNIPRFKGHLQSIEQVILNLIINAIEAIDHDQGIITITADYDQQSRNICLSLADNGMGIDPAVIEKIFDPFYTEKQVQGGTGLGLSCHTVL
jgi:PAS domain S-box-containing protein